MKKFNLMPALLAVAVSLASGCSTYQDKHDIDGYSDDMGRVTNSQVNRNTSQVTLDAKRAAQDVPLPYITGKAIPLAREVTLPGPLRGTIDATMLFSNDADLVTLASRIQGATGIPVKVMPDALLPMEDFGPRLDDVQKGNSAFKGGVATPSPMSAGGFVALDSPLPGADGVQVMTVPIAGSAPKVFEVSKAKSLGAQPPLDKTLDQIAVRLGVYWKWDEDLRAIVFYRTETRTFELRGAEMAASSEMGIDLSGGVDNKNSSGLTSKSKASIDVQGSKDGPMTALISRITQFMSRSGKVAVGAGGLLVVTDIKSSLDQIETFVTQENRMRSRRIDLVFEEVTVERNSTSQAGNNWNIVFGGTSSGNGINVSGLNSLLDQAGAAMSLGASVGSGPFAGSSVTVQALSTVGKVVDRKVNSFGSISGQPATSGRPQRQKYIDKLEQTQSQSNVSGPTVTVTQAEEVSGRIITVLPYAYSDGDINLAIKYDNTPTPTFTKQVQSDGSYVQSPSSVSDVLVRTAIVHSGQPFVVSAETVNSANYDERRTDRNLSMAFGGSDSATKSDRVKVFVLTAMVHEK